MVQDNTAYMIVYRMCFCIRNNIWTIYLITQVYTLFPCAELYAESSCVYGFVYGLYFCRWSCARNMFLYTDLYMEYIFRVRKWTWIVFLCIQSYTFRRRNCIRNKSPHAELHAECFSVYTVVYGIHVRTRNRIRNEFASGIFIPIASGQR